jgi:hypothetical protein
MIRVTLTTKLKGYEPSAIKIVDLKEYYIYIFADMKTWQKALKENTKEEL